MSPVFLGLDTSNYKTSAGLFCPETGAFRQCGKLLSVPRGSLGLRQSEALFQHIRQLADRVREALDGEDSSIAAIGFSARPRDLEGSYMPCFLAGECAARCMGSALRVPVYDFSHQQGHLAAAAFSAGRLDLLTRPFLAWHLSGGTTELLLVEPSRERIIAESILGGTQDISAGQLIDRVGVALGTPFPAGPYVEQMALRSQSTERFSVRLSGGELFPLGDGKSVPPPPGRGAEARGCLPLCFEHGGLDHPPGHAPGPGAAPSPGAHLRGRFGVLPGAGGLCRGGGRFLRRPGSGGRQRGRGRYFGFHEVKIWHFSRFRSHS